MTMGKVASKSICATLKALPADRFPVQVYHVHSMNVPNNLKALPSALPIAHFSVGNALAALFSTRATFFKWKFISGVRDPISTAISIVFERYGNLPDLGDITIKTQHAVEYILSYFDVYYRELTGINVFDYPFDPDQGYAILKKDNIEILLYRLEDLPRTFSLAIERYLGIEDLELVKANLGSRKDYALAYERAKKNIRFGSHFLDTVYSSKLATHFYTDAEISRLYQHWLNGHKVSTHFPEEKSMPLIYDLGLHEGQDTEFYLKKGFKVIAVDANPVMVEKAMTKFGRYLTTGQLVLINAGVVESATDALLPFYVNDQNAEWSSFSKEIATRGKCPYHVVMVPCTTLADLLSKYGPPYYIKIDIEGFDHIALESLLSVQFKPRFVSVENGNMGMLDMMVSMGYDAFKYVQQNNVAKVKLPYPPREGKWVKHAFVPGASGPFGEETLGEWKTANEIRKEISRVWDPETNAKNSEHKDAIHGWFDLHARLAY